MNKNQEAVGIVTALGMSGEGIVKRENIPVFIPFALPGEEIRYRVVKVKKGFAFGKLLEVLIPSPDRREPVCPAFGRCGGCQLQHMDYAAQRSYKRAYVEDCFRKIAFLEIQAEETVARGEPYRYRNKLQLPAGQGGTFGFYAVNSHRVVPIGDCPIQPAWARKIISLFSAYCAECGVVAYDEAARTGFLRHIVVREVSGKMMIAVVGTSERLPGREKLIGMLNGAFPSVTLYLNVNDRDTNVIFGPRFILLSGEPRYRVNVFGIACEFGVESFLQVNFAVAEALYRDAVMAASPDGDTTVVDAYSGAGLMTAMLARGAKRAIGIECVREAVECADRVAALNGLEGRMENICAACEDVLPALVRDLRGRGEKLAVVLDPPRKGCDWAVIEAIARAEPDRVVYVSCNPATLARDVGLLTGALVRTEKGIVRADCPAMRYEVAFVRPFDMFPQTANVETLVLLRRRGAES